MQQLFVEREKRPYVTVIVVVKHGGIRLILLVLLPPSLWPDQADPADESLPSVRASTQEIYRKATHELTVDGVNLRPGEQHQATVRPPAAGGCMVQAGGGRRKTLIIMEIVHLFRGSIPHLFFPYVTDL